MNRLFFLAYSLKNINRKADDNMKLTPMKLKRLQLGLQQGQVAKQLGITQGYLSQLENNSTPIVGDIIIRLAKIYDCSTKDLV